jgi:hypothetical protein
MVQKETHQSQYRKSATRNLAGFDTLSHPFPNVKSQMVQRENADFFFRRNLNKKRSIIPPDLKYHPNLLPPNRGRKKLFA